MSVFSLIGFIVFIATQQDSASAQGSEQECCACGHARYSVTFQGLWSRQTHPKGFPDEKNSFQLHWSNLVGASHSGKYKIWDYGQLASRAVKEVCEYGSSRTLENDMRDNSDKILSVVKTKQLWGPVNILESLNAVYSANKKKPLLSLITMIGPSPDWCLGVSGINMCETNCTWKDSMDIDLYPWDAGTDSRVTYLGRKMAQIPPERIHRITSTYPNDRESPFFGEEIRPFARLTIRKTKDVCTDDEGRSTSAEAPPSTDELVSEMKKKMMRKKKLEMEKCATSQWSSWGDCNNPCGNGVKERRRMLKNNGITAAMCDLKLLESTSCVGDCTDSRRNKLSSNFVMRHEEARDPNNKCAVTNWSDWSPCSATCGIGMKERWRQFLHSDAPTNCGIHIMEKDVCQDVMDCRKALMMKNFTSICQLPADVGPCRGDFPRWFYNHTSQKCQVFSWAGCRGNDNRFETERECVDLCAEHMADVMRNPPRSSKHMMSKETLMNKQRMMEKQREMEKQLMMEKQKTMEEDMRRKQALMKKQRMLEQQGQADMSDMERKALMMKQAMMKQQQQEEEKARRMKEAMMKQQQEEEKARRMKQAMMKRQQREEAKARRMKEARMRQQQEEAKARMTKEAMMRQEEAKARMMKEAMMRKQQEEEKQKMLMLSKQKTGQTSELSAAEKAKAKLLRKHKRKMRQKRRRQKRLRNKDRLSRKGKRGRQYRDKQSDSPSVDCMVTPWSDWTPCSVSCGRGVTEKARMIKRRAQNGGKRCPRRLVKKKKCKVKKCSIDCAVGEWGDWQPCTKTCGASSVQMRRREVITRPKYNGMICPTRREKRTCEVPLCPNSEIQQ